LGIICILGYTKMTNVWIWISHIQMSQKISYFVIFM
jgi:hypothetical protein